MTKIWKWCAYSSQEQIRCSLLEWIRLTCPGMNWCLKCKTTYRRELCTSQQVCALPISGSLSHNWRLQKQWSYQEHSAEMWKVFDLYNSRYWLALNIYEQCTGMPAVPDCERSVEMPPLGGNHRTMFKLEVAPLARFYSRRHHICSIVKRKEYPESLGVRVCSQTGPVFEPFRC